MLLKLIPPNPLPTVLFTLAYPAPPSNLPLPASYAALLKLVVEESLLDADHNIFERIDGPLPLGRHAGLSPTLSRVGGGGSGGVNNGQGSLTPHALDKATWIAAVLNEVVFDLSDGAFIGEGSAPIEQRTDPFEDAAPRRVRVLCRYVDGAEVSWEWNATPDAENDADGEAAACFAALQSVLHDVSESATASERERRERKKRHTYYERFAFVEAHPHQGVYGALEQRGRHPIPQGTEEEGTMEGKQHSAGFMPVQQGYGSEEARDHGRAGPRSFDEELDFGRGAEAHVSGRVETRRGKGKKGRKSVRGGGNSKHEETGKEDVEEGKDGMKEKGKHKKQRSLLMSLVAFASSISPRSIRSRSPSPSPSPPAELESSTSHAVPTSRSPSPKPPHVVHPHLVFTPYQDPPLSSSDLCRRARATLVDVFRRYVIAKLKTPQALPSRVLRRVLSVDSGNADAGRRLRSVGSALTTRSSDFSLSEASMHVHSVSRSPSVSVLRASDILCGIDAELLHQRLVSGYSDEDDEDELAFGSANEGEYVTWVTRSLLTRLEAEMREMSVILRSMRVPAPPPRISSISNSLSARMGLSPIDGPPLSNAGAFQPISGFSDDVGEWGVAAGATLIDESPPFFDSYDEEEMENVPLTEESITEDEDHTSMSASSSSGTTETDNSSVHTPSSETTNFDQACIRSPGTPPLAEHDRGDYFVGVQDQSTEFEAQQQPGSSPPRRPVLKKQPPILATKETEFLPPLLDELARPACRPALSPLLTVSPPRSVSLPPSSTFTSPEGSLSSASALPAAAYAALSGERERLLGILNRLANQHNVAQQDEKQLLNDLEAKSRRRAWSNRAFVGGATVRLCGLAMPERHSPLVTAKPITPGDLEAEAKAYACAQLEGVGGVKKKRGSLVATTAESNIMRLFPVCEEDEDGSDEEGDQSFLVTSPLSDSSFAIGAFPTSPTIASSFAASGAAAREEEEEEPAGEDGPLRPLDPPASPGSGPSDDEMLTLSDAEDDLLGFAPLMRHSSRHTSVPVRPRPRTRCMSMSSVAASSGEPLLSVPVGALHAGFPTLARASLLPAPGVPYMMHESSASTADLLRAAVDADTEKMEFGVLEPQTKVELFDVYSGDEEDEEDDRCTDGKENEDAFVLGVDVAGRAELSAFCAAHQQPTSADGIRVLAAHL